MSEDVKFDSSMPVPRVFEADIRNLTGEILTIIDATVAAPQQNKAAKDLAKNKIWFWYSQACKAEEYSQQGLDQGTKEN